MQTIRGYYDGWVLVLVLSSASPLSAFQGFHSFRTELLNHYQEISEVARTYSDATTKDLAELTAKARKQAMELSAQDLRLLEETLSTVPNWRSIPHSLRSALELKTRNSLEAVPKAQPPDCPAGLPNGIIDLYIAKDTAQGLAFAILFAPNDLVTVAAGFGGTISAHPIKIALQVSYEAANTAALVLEQINALNDECETNAHRALLRLVDDKIDILTQKVDEVLAREIEEDLNSCTSLVSLYLPAQNGGRLETIATLLRGWIEQSELAGLKGSKAWEFYDKGLVDIQNSAYKEAYNNFCKSYNHLANPGPQ
jgi:hypothetical protein